MTRHLLDSDTVIDFLQGVASTVAFVQNLSQQGDVLCTNDVVLAEVYTGLHPQDYQRAEQFLATLTYLPASDAAARQAGAWRYTYARQGQALSLPDCLIAACAQEHQATIVTGNVRDFPMPGITVIALPRPRR